MKRSALRQLSPLRDLRLHASAVLIGESAILVRGPSGSGKTGLCLHLIEAARATRVFARLIGDDQIDVCMRHGRLLARPVAAIAGVVERRGLGLVPVAHEAVACVRLVVDLQDEAVVRMPEPDMMVTEIATVTLPRICCQVGRIDVGQVLAALALFNDEPWLG